MLAVLASLIGAGIPQTAPQAPPPTIVAIEPSEKWVVDGEEGLCMLSRRFGSAPASMLFALRPLGSAEQTELILLVPRDRAGVRSGRAEVTFDDGPPIAAHFGSHIREKQGQRATTVRVEQNLVPSLAKASRLTIEFGGTRVALHVTSAAAAVKALSMCEDLAVSRWGVDAAAYRAETVHAKMTDGGKAFGPDQYPRSALRARAQGRTVAVLTIDGDGHPTDCRVVASAGNAALDEATCRVALHGARFTSAKGADGRPVKASFVLPISWLIPGG